MLANDPDVDRSTRTNRPLPQERAKGEVADVGSVGHPVRRVGLEQEFFLVDREGALSDLADPFLRRCRDAARAEGLDPLCFKAECHHGTVEIRSMDEQLSSLRRKYDETPPGGEHEPEAARVIYIRDSSTFFAEGARPAGVDDAQALARAANKRPA